MCPNMTCTCVSKRPGSSVVPETSTASSPSSPRPTSTIHSPSTATSASTGAAPVPSNTSPPANTVLISDSSRRWPGQRNGSAAGALLQADGEGVERHGEEEHAAGDDVDVAVRHVERVQAVLQRPDEGGAERRAAHLAAPAEEADAADDGG